MSEDNKQQRINESEWKNPANWRWGLFYFSETDSRDWVPKRAMMGRKRFGGTPNLAKKSARIYMLLLFGLFTLVFILVASLERSGFLR